MNLLFRKLTNKVDEESIPNHIQEAADQACQKLLPELSKSRYEQVYQQFSKWCQENKIKSTSETVLLAYFVKLSKGMKSATLWARYSMLKSTMMLKTGVDISTYSKLVAFLKRGHAGYTSKKSKTFTREEIFIFLKNADNEEFLMIKVAVIFGIAGACRRLELTNMLTEHIEDMKTHLIVKIPDTKTKIERIFKVTETIMNDLGTVNYLDIYRKYVNLRPNNINHNRFFICYKKGKCSSQPIGVNAFGKLPQKIAKFLGLPNPRQYTGHCFRRSSATVLADSEGDITNIKRRTGCRCTSISEESSVENMKNNEHVESSNT